MSENVEKETKQEEPKKKVKRSNPFKGVVSGELLTRAGVVKNLPFLLFVAFLMVVYIGYGYYVDNTVRKITKEERVGEELYSQLQSLMELYDEKSLRSKVAEDVAASGLFETKDPPRVVWVDSTFYKVSGE